MQQNTAVPDTIVVTSISAISIIVEQALRNVLTNHSPHSTVVDEILDVEHAAQFLKMSVSALYSYTSQRKIPHFKRSKRLYFKRSEIAAWLDAGRKKTRDEVAEEAGISRKGGKRL